MTHHHAWLNKQAQLIKRSKEEFVQHNKTKYGLPLAMWVACEVWDFGTLSSLFSGMHESDQDAIAHLYGVRNEPVINFVCKAYHVQQEHVCQAKRS